MNPNKIILAALLCCVSCVIAQEENKTDTEKAVVTDQDSIVSLSDMVVTATGGEKDRFETSLPINIMELRDMEEKITTTIAEIFKDEPGVDAVTAGTGSLHPMIRGLSGARVLVLVDGIRLSEQRPGGNHAFSLDPAQVERVEVVRGPASVLYGSDAIGGVINFITKRAEERTDPEERISGEAEVQYESASEGYKESGHLRFGKGRFNGYAGATYKDNDNIETVDGELNNSFYEGYTVWAGGNYIGDGWKSYLDYSFMEADIGVPGPDAFAEDYFKDERHQRLAWGFEMDEFQSEYIESLSLDLGWQRHNRNRYRRKTTGIPAAVAGDLEVNIEVDQDTYTFKPKMVLTPSESHRVTVGLDTFYEDATSERTIGDTLSDWENPKFSGVPVIPDSNRMGLGAFVQDEIFLGERWIVTPGLRADWIRAEADGEPGHQISRNETSINSAVSGNLGLLYKLDESVNIYANAGRAFRAPTLLEMYFYGPHDVGNDIGDPDLDSETSWNFDLGVKGRTERLKTMAGVFYNIIDDYITKENQGDGNYKYMNYDKAVLYGAESGLEYDIGLGISAFSSLSYVRGKNDKSGENLTGIPPLKAIYGMRYDRSIGETSAFWTEISGTSATEQDRTVSMNAKLPDTPKATSAQV